MKTKISISVIEVIKRSISLTLAFIMLGNLMAEAMPKQTMAVRHQQIVNAIEQQLQLSPTEKLRIINEQLLKGFTDSSEKTSETMDKETQEIIAAFTQKSREEFLSEYKKLAGDSLAKEQKALQAEYNKQIEALQTSLDESYALAQQEALDESGKIADDKVLQLGIYKSYLKDEQEKNLAELKANFEQAQNKLNKDFSSYINDGDNAYREYLDSFSQAQQDFRRAVNEQLNAFLQEAIDAYKAVSDTAQSYSISARTTDLEKVKTAAQAMENFLSIITVLASIEDHEAIFQGVDLAYIHKFLQSFIKNGACSTHQETTYDPQADYNTSSYAPIGGSPSAAKMYAVQSAKRYSVELDNPKTCEYALTALIPYGTLKGAPAVVAEFVKSHYQSATFATVLLFGTRSLLLSKEPQRVAVLKPIVEKSIRLENDARNGKTGSWTDSLDFLDFLQIGYWTRKTITDGPYVNHNVAASGQQANGEDNLWEDFAKLLAGEMHQGNQNAKEILTLAVNQCELKTSGGYSWFGQQDNNKQWLECGGIYPFLFGVLRYAPELAESLKVHSWPNKPTVSGYAIGGYNGKSRYVTPEEADANKQWIKEHDVLEKFTKAEVLAMDFYGKVFEGQTMLEKQRIDNIIARSNILNKHKKMLPYKKGDDTYKSIERLTNMGLVLNALADYADQLIALVLLTKLGASALGKVFTIFKMLTKAKTIRVMILSFKLIPNLSLAKGVKMANAFKAAGLNPQILLKLNAIPQKIKQIKRFKTKTLANFRSAYATTYVFKPFVTVKSVNSMKGAVGSVGITKVAGATELTGVSGAVSEVHTVGGTAFWGGNGRIVRPKPLTREAAQKEIPLYGKGSPAYPWNTKEKANFELNKEGLTAQYFALEVNEDGTAVKRLVEIKDLGFKDKVLYINGQMAKTFKAYIPMDQLESLSAIAKDSGFGFDFKGVWVRLYREGELPEDIKTFSEVKQTAGNVGQIARAKKIKGVKKNKGTPIEPDEKVIPLKQKEDLGFWGNLRKKLKTRHEKRLSLDENTYVVPLYDETGTRQILGVGLNPGDKIQAVLLEKLDPKTFKEWKAAKDSKWFRKKTAKVEDIVPDAKLIYKDGKIFLQEGKKLKWLEEYKGVGIPKTVFSNVTDIREVEKVQAVKEAKEAANVAKATKFLNQLFALGGAEGKGGLILCQTKDKLGFAKMLNVLSYSAASSALMMTLEADVGPFISTAVGLGLPYISAFLAPILAPFVERFGARTVVLASLGLATASLAYVMLSGWYGDGMAWNEKTGKKDILKASKWPLIINALLTGIAATGLRASSNAILKAYETSPSTLVGSMVWKSVGALTTTALPLGWYLCAGLREDKTVDFSFAFPIMFVLTVAAAAGIRLNFPKKANPAAKITAQTIRDSFAYIRPVWWGFWNGEAGKVGPLARNVWGMMLMSSMEGYVYFKAISAVYRDIAKGQFSLDDTPAKLVAAVASAIPQVFVRSSGLGKVKQIERASNFKLGVVNSIALSLAGTLLYMLPLDNADNGTKIFQGLLSGILLGMGTANIFQYTQKVTLNRADLLGIKPAHTTTVFSVANLGLALPLFPAAFAKSLKENKGYSEAEANQKTSSIPLGFYLFGMMLFGMGEGVIGNVFRPVAKALNLGWKIGATGDALDQVKKSAIPAPAVDPYTTSPIVPGFGTIKRPLLTPQEIDDAFLEQQTQEQRDTFVRSVQAKHMQSFFGNSFLSRYLDLESGEVKNAEQERVTEEKPLYERLYEAEVERQNQAIRNKIYCGLLLYNHFKILFPGIGLTALMKAAIDSRNSFHPKFSQSKREPVLQGAN